jgi:hypothetical protein
MMVQHNGEPKELKNCSFYGHIHIIYIVTRINQNLLKNNCVNVPGVVVTPQLSQDQEGHSGQGKKQHSDVEEINRTSVAAGQFFWWDYYGVNFRTSLVDNSSARAIMTLTTKDLYCVSHGATLSC